MSLTRRTPLQRGKHPLKRTPIRRVSSKRARENRIYSAKRKAFLEAHPLCQRWLADNGWSELGQGFYHKPGWGPESDLSLEGIGAPRSTEVHHKAGRLRRKPPLDSRSPIN